MAMFEIEYQFKFNMLNFKTFLKYFVCNNFEQCGDIKIFKVLK